MQPVQKQYNFIDFQLSQPKLLTNKENPNDDKLHLLINWTLDGLNNVIMYNTADYNYYIRILFYNIKKNIDIFIKNDDKDILKLYNDPLLNSLISESFDYYNLNKEFFKSDRSLSTMITTCVKPELIYDPNIEDQYLIDLAYWFNSLVNANRKILRCYDCGTNARAIYLNLIKHNRNNNLYISEFERERMKNMYNVKDKNTLDIIDECDDFITNVQKDCAIIISLGFINSGHVFVLEKRFDELNKPLILHYQSALNSHMVIDFLYLVDIVEKIKNNRSVNYKKLFNDLRYLFKLKKWSDEDKLLFGTWFLYVTGDNIDLTKFNDEIEISNNYKFIWTYVIYSES